MNSEGGVKSGVPERVSISCPTWGTRHDLPKTTGNQSCVTVGEQTILFLQSMTTCMTTNVELKGLFTNCDI